MTKCASADALKNLLQLLQAKGLRLILNTEQWLAVADEIHRGRCNIQTLTLAMLQVTRSAATEAVKALSSAIQMDHNLEYIYLEMENGFMDEAGVALAEALTVNKTLRTIKLASTMNAIRYVRNRATLGTQSYEAFAAVLRVNTGLILKLPPRSLELFVVKGFLSLLVRCICSSD